MVARQYVTTIGLNRRITRDLLACSSFICIPRNRNVCALRFSAIVDSKFHRRRRLLIAVFVSLSQFVRFAVISRVRCAHGTRDRPRWYCRCVSRVAATRDPRAPSNPDHAADHVENEEQKYRRRATGLLPQSGAQHHTVPSSTLHLAVLGFYRITINDALPSKKFAHNAYFEQNLNMPIRVSPGFNLRVGRHANVWFYSYFSFYVKQR